MKGLLLKDFYMIVKYFKMYFLLDAIFIVAAFISPGNTFLLVPVLIAGLIPITLLGYDEKSRWTEYCGVLPYSKAQVVSAKYIIGLLMQGMMCAVSFLALLVSGMYHGEANPADAAVTMIEMFVAALLFPAVCLPFCFRFGTEKGRIVIIVVISAITAASVLLLKDDDFITDIAAQGSALTSALPLFMIVTAAVYALSWLLSIALYNKKEAGKV